MTRLVVAGVDPGPTPGVVVLYLAIVETHFVQRSARCWSASTSTATASTWSPQHAYVVGRRSGRSATSGAGEITRDQAAQLQLMFSRVVLRASGQVKPWATDARLDAAGMLEAT